MANTLVICEECSKMGLKSTVYSHGSISTCMADHTFYDEEGRYHHHSMNTSTEQLQCSNGHYFGRSTTPKCWCEKD